MADEQGLPPLVWKCPVCGWETDEDFVPCELCGAKMLIVEKKEE